MKQVFYTSFLRDVKKIRNKNIAQAVKDVIQLTSSCEHPSEIPNLKKLKEQRTAFRIRIDDYIIGLFIEQGTIYFATFDHRSRIYHNFP